MKAKRIIACILVTCTMLGSMSFQGISSMVGMAADSGVMRENMTAQDYADEMGLGINLGNTMEGFWEDLSRVDSGASPNPGSRPQDFEVCWMGKDAVETTQAVINGMRDAGFKTVRIPVYWGNMMAEDGTFTINPQYIGRVKEIVDYCRNAGLYAVVNIHHYDEYLIKRFAKANDLKRCSEVFNHLWTQIAEYFKDYSDYLVFEGYNEAVGYVEKGQNPYEWAHTLNQTFVDAVRATGGNNAKRVLIASGYFTNIDNTTKPDFIMPTDTIEDRMMISVHYVDNATYWSSEIGNEDWEMYSVSQLNLLKRAFYDKGIPVFIGESTTSTSYQGHIAQDAKITDPTKAMDFMLRLIRGYGFVPVLWDTNNNFYSRTKCKIKIDSDAKAVSALAKELENGTFVPPETDYVPPMSTDDALGLIYSSAPALKLASGIADADIAGAVKVRYIFDCAEDVAFNQWSGILLSATVADVTSKNPVVGSGNMSGLTNIKAILELTNPINEGDSYSIYAYSNSWEDAADYVFLIRRIEFLGADGNVIKTIDKSNKPSEPTTDPTEPSESDPSSEPSSDSSKPKTDPTTSPTKAPSTKATRSPAQVTKDKNNAQKTMNQAKITSLKAKAKGKKKIVVSWKKVTKAVGYEVQVAKNNKFKKAIIDKFTPKTKIKIKGNKIKSKKTYFVRVRAYSTYKDANNKPQKVYSKWIKKVRKVKVK